MPRTHAPPPSLPCTCVNALARAALPAQRLGMLVAVMLARGRAPIAAAASRTALAAALGTLPSGVLAMLADAVLGNDNADY